MNKLLIMSKGMKEYIEATTDGLARRAPINKGKTAIVNLGVPVFKRNRSRFGGGECMFRICQEGARCIAPFMQKRMVKVKSEEEFKEVLGVGVDRSDVSRRGD